MFFKLFLHLFSSKIPAHTHENTLCQGTSRTLTIPSVWLTATPAEKLPALRVSLVAPLVTTAEPAFPYRLNAAPGLFLLRILQPQPPPSLSSPPRVFSCAYTDFWKRCPCSLKNTNSRRSAINCVYGSAISLFTSREGEGVVNRYKNCGTQAKRIRGDPANAGAGEASAPSEWWGDNLFFCRRWDPQFFVFGFYETEFKNIEHFGVIQ